MRVETAIKMIENHGHKAFVTAEGLACVGTVYDLNKNNVEFAHDCVFEEVTTFPIEEMPASKLFPATVSKQAIRNWLGY